MTSPQPDSLASAGGRAGWIASDEVETAPPIHALDKSSVIRIAAERLTNIKHGSRPAQ
jgi:hypothetical protein